MKFTWEIADFKTGREVVAHGCLYVIGYLLDRSEPDKYCLIDLRDGAIFTAKTKEEMINALNREGYAPRYEAVEPHLK